jgi:hypothetical protein
MEVSGQLHAPAALPPGKKPLVSIGWEAGWAPEPLSLSIGDKNMDIGLQKFSKLFKINECTFRVSHQAQKLVCLAITSVRKRKEL